MQVIGFNFSRISGEKTENFTKAKVNADIQFTDFEKQKVDILKDSEAVKVSFKHILTYENEDAKKDSNDAEVAFEGNIMLSVNKDESKNIMKSWKKKEAPDNVVLSIYNLILKKCAPKALQLQEELGLPTHIKIPRLSSQKQQT